MSDKAIKNVTIIGLGLMGCGIAQCFAGCEDLKIKGYDNYTTEPEVMKRIKANLDIFIDKNIMNEDHAKDILSRIEVVDSMEDAVKDADLIVECIIENMELKQNLFKALEPLCKPDTIFATNTSVMSITEIFSKIENKSRAVGTHFWNPPYLIPLVEVVKADETSEATVEATMEILKKANKHPIKVNKDVPGFVANRLQHAMWREAISIVENGIADAATVDEAIKYGPGLRLPILAPMENADMVGLDLTIAIHSYILKYLEDSHEPSPLLKEKVEKGDLGFKSGKGFQTWTAEEAEASRKRLSEYLIKVLYNK